MTAETKIFTKHFVKYIEKELKTIGNVADVIRPTPSRPQVVLMGRWYMLYYW